MKRALVSVVLFALACASAPRVRDVPLVTPSRLRVCAPGGGFGSFGSEIECVTVAIDGGIEGEQFILRIPANDTVELVECDL